MWLEKFSPLLQLEVNRSFISGMRKTGIRIVCGQTQGPKHRLRGQRGTRRSDERPVRSCSSARAASASPGTHTPSAARRNRKRNGPSARRPRRTFHPSALTGASSLKPGATSSRNQWLRVSGQRRRQTRGRACRSLKGSVTARSSPVQNYTGAARRPHPAGGGARRRPEQEPPLGAACRGQATTRERARDGARQCVGSPPRRSPRRHVCRQDVAPGAHLPRDFRPLHLGLPHGGAPRPPPRRERRRQSEWRGAGAGTWRAPRVPGALPAGLRAGLGVCSKSPGRRAPGVVPARLGCGAGGGRGYTTRPGRLAVDQKAPSFVFEPLGSGTVPGTE